jgi:hypothetical protein
VQQTEVDGVNLFFVIQENRSLTVGKDEEENEKRKSFHFSIISFL